MSETDSAIESVVQTENGAPVWVTFYAWWKPDMPSESAYRYWRDIHGVWASRTPGFYQYRQLHLGRVEPELLAGLSGIETDLPESEQPSGIAHIAYRSELHFRILRLPFALQQAEQDELYFVSRNAVQRASLPGTRTYVDRTNNAEPNGPSTTPRFLLAFRRSKGMSEAAFRTHLAERLASRWSERSDVTRVRLELLEPYDEPAPTKGGVDHAWEEDKRYDALLDVQLTEDGTLAKLFDEPERDTSTIEAIHAYPIREVYTLVYGGKPTLVGLRGYPAVETIETAGAEFQKSQQVLKFTYGPATDGVRLVPRGALWGLGIALLAAVIVGARYWF